MFDREAIALRDALLEALQQIRVPENPLDSIINTFGSDRVAEVTGRGRRFVRLVTMRVILRLLKKSAVKTHPGRCRSVPERQKRHPDIFRGGWNRVFLPCRQHGRKPAQAYSLQFTARLASRQGGTRIWGTHRTNQAQEPHYVLPTTNLKRKSGLCHRLPEDSIIWGR